MSTNKQAWIDAGEATALLGVSRATLYAYVSRGRIRSEAAPGVERRSRYSRDDVLVRAARELLQSVTRDDQLAALAVDHAEPRLGGDHALEAAVRSNCRLRFHGAAR